MSNNCTHNTTINPLALVVTTVKEWAKARKRLADSVNGGLSSYSWTILVIAYLIEARWLPCLGAQWQQENVVKRACEGLQDEDEGDAELFHDWIAEGYTAEEVMGSVRLQAWKELFRERDGHTAGEQGLRQLLTGFFEYYGYIFDYYRDAVDIRGIRGGGGAIGQQNKGRIAKASIVFNLSTTSSLGIKNSDRHKRNSWLWIVDPFELNRIIVPNDAMMEEIIEELQRGYRICCHNDEGEEDKGWKEKLLSSSTNDSSSGGSNSSNVHIDRLFPNDVNNFMSAVQEYLFHSL